MTTKTETQARTILIVDDIPQNIDLLGKVLTDYRRTFATDGEQALERARSTPPPDLILLDVMMPGLSGFEVCEALKQDPETRDIPVIFVTALNEVKDEATGLELGAVDYITKPISPAVVRERVKTQLELRDARVRLASQNEILEEQATTRTAEPSTALTKLRDASLDTILRLTKAAEYRDDDTGAHVKRMSEYSAAVARRMGLPEETCEQVLHAAPMHDIGKIGIPDRILLKPGRLDGAEWDVMRRHSKIGADILEGSDAEEIKLGGVVALTHHEKWDGSGYPRGLAGEDIPQVGRIVAIADVFDALTSERPYKKAFSLDKSFGIIREGRGGHFDPAVVDAFFETEAELLEIKDRNQDSRIPHLLQLGVEPAPEGT